MPVGVTHPVGARLVEASTLIEPIPGVSVYQAIRDAQLAGYVAIEVHNNNTATVIWHRED